MQIKEFWRMNYLGVETRQRKAKVENTSITVFESRHSKTVLTSATF